MTEYEEFCRAEAARRGIDPQIAVRVANSEGGLTEPARRGTFPTGSSWYAFQLHWGGAGYEHFGTVAGMGNEFSRVTGWKPGDPAAWRDAMRWALDRAKWSGWGAWYGAAAVGIGTWDGIDRTFSWAATPDDEWDYKTGAPSAPIMLPYNPDAPCYVQPDDWSCSIQSAQFLLRSIGRNPGDQWMHDQLVPGIVSPDVGLKNATGKALAEWITREYGSEMGFVAQYSPVTFDDVKAGAGVNPTMVGGRRYGPGGHWVGIRRVASDGALELANPAPNYTDTGPTLDRAEWDARGPWSAIWIDRMSALAPPPPPPAPAPAPEPAPEPAPPVEPPADELARLHLENGQLHVRISELITERDAAQASAQRHADRCERLRAAMAQAVETLKGVA